jgi:hypothetical protein
MTSEQRCEVTAEDRYYWSGENLMNSLVDITIDDLTWENKLLKKNLYLEKAKVRDLISQLKAANKKIRELTGEDERELEEYPHAIEIERQYCCEDFSFLNENTFEIDPNPVVTIDNNQSFFGVLPTDGEPLEPEVGNNQSFFGVLPTDGEPLEPEVESYINNNGIRVYHHPNNV